MEKFIVKVCFPYGNNPDKKYKFLAFEKYSTRDMVVVSNTNGSLSVAEVVSVSPYICSSGATRPIVCKVDDRNLTLYNRLSELEVMRQEVDSILRNMEKIKSEIAVLMEEQK